MPDRVRLYWDACVFLSYINELPDRLRDIEALLEQAQRGEIQIVTSVVSVAEVAFAASEQQAHALDDKQEERIARLWALGSPVQLVDVHMLVAEKARLIQRSGVPEGWTGLRSPDAIHLATAQHEDVTEVNTYDPGWDKYASVIGRPIRRPVAVQPQLGLASEPPSVPLPPFEQYPAEAQE